MQLLIRLDGDATTAKEGGEDAVSLTHLAFDPRGTAPTGWGARFEHGAFDGTIPCCECSAPKEGIGDIAVIIHTPNGSLTVEDGMTIAPMEVRRRTRSPQTAELLWTDQVDGLALCPPLGHQRQGWTRGSSLPIVATGFAHKAGGDEQRSSAVFSCVVIQ